MDKFYNDKLQKLETVINDFEIEADCSIQRIETVIHDRTSSRRAKNMGREAPPFHVSSTCFPKFIRLTIL